MIRTRDDVHHDDVANEMILFMFCALMSILRSNLFTNFFNELTLFDFLMKRFFMIVSYVELVINLIVVALMSLSNRKCMSMKLISMLSVFFEVALYALVIVFSV